MFKNENQFFIYSFQVRPIVDFRIISGRVQVLQPAVIGIPAAVVSIPVSVIGIPTAVIGIPAATIARFPGHVLARRGFQEHRVAVPFQLLGPRFLYIITVPAIFGTPKDYHRPVGQFAAFHLVSGPPAAQPGVQIRSVFRAIPVSGSRP